MSRGCLIEKKQNRWATYIGGYRMGYEKIKFSEESKFLITGAAGFIGSNLVEAIINLGYQVRGLDNFSTGKRENVDLFKENSNFEFIEGDIRNLDTCMKACEGIDYVLNQAAWGSVPRSIEMPLLYEEINIRGTLNMMEAARQNGVKKFVYASSSSVYGDEPNLPKKEGIEGNLLSPYALTKKVDEEYGKLYTRLYGLDTYGLRYFNVFGRRQDPNGVYAAVIPKFIKQLLNDERPTIDGDGKQSRDFTYIENVIEANLKACKSSHEVAGHAFNIAYGGREYLINIYYDLCKALDKDIKPVFGSDRPGDIKHSNADISRAKELLDYNPSYSFEDGIKLAINWYKENL
jgi:UDP-N-acetylglucosamine 4-epimerase